MPDSQLLPLHLEKSVECYELRIAPNVLLRSAPHFERTQELLTASSGCAGIHARDNRCPLAEGDSVPYLAGLQHTIENSGDQ